MNLSVLEKREIAVNLIGYGKPDANLWIMGFEERRNELSSAKLNRLVFRNAV